MKIIRRLVRRCPHADCPSQLSGVVSRVVGHSSFPTKKGPRRRLRCKACGRTLVARIGTVYYRLRASRDSFDLAMRLSVEGLSQAATARAQGLSPGTISRWRERAARHARRFAEHPTVRDPVETQLDELRSPGVPMNTRVFVVSSSSARIGLALACAILGLGAAARAQVKLHSLLGDAPSDQLGTDVAAAGDVDGDGVQDFIAGAPYKFSGSTHNYARVYSGATGATLHTFSSALTNDYFGRTVGGAGDVNDDGFADVVVGSMYASTADPNGRAQVFSGLTGALLHTFTGDPKTWFGPEAVTGVGDLDGDGHDDVLVAEPGNDAGGLDAGRVRVYSGATGGVLRQLDGAAYERLGYSAAAAGDVDADGTPDFVVGGGSNPNLGRAWAVSGATGTVLHTWTGASAFDGFGMTVGGAGDVNADDHDDVIVGAPFDSTVAPQSGMARVYSGLDGSVLHTVYGPPYVHQFGTDVGTAGDRDGDGFDDFLVSTRDDDTVGSGTGSVTIFSGADAHVLYKLTGNATNDDFGNAAAMLGDVDGDGGIDYLVGARRGDAPPDCGRVYVLTLAPTYTNYCQSAPNSTGVPATLHGSGYGTWGNNDLVLTAVNLPPNTAGLVLASETAAQTPLGNGFLCLAPKVWRIAPVLSSGPTGTITAPVSKSVYPWYALLNAGETWYLQVWFRDTSAGGAGFNLTDGLRVTFVP